MTFLSEVVFHLHAQIILTQNRDKVLVIDGVSCGGVNNSSSRSYDFGLEPFVDTSALI